MHNPQLNRPRIDPPVVDRGLPQPFTRILDTAAPFMEVSHAMSRKCPVARQKRVFNLFFGRTRRAREPRSR